MVTALLLLAPARAAASGHEAPSQPGELDMKSYIFGHIGDAYEWHITTVNGHHVSIPLPCILIDGGLHVFLSNHIEGSGYTLNEDGKLVNAATGARPIDISITKNVCSLILSSILLVVLVLLTARWYRKHDVLKEAPKGFTGLMEMLIMMVTNDIIKEGVGKEYAGLFSPAATLYYRFLTQAKQTGIRTVIVIAGNHDSASFLEAPKSILDILDCKVIGKADPEKYDEEIIPLRNAEGGTEAVVCAVPYLRDRDIRVQPVADRADFFVRDAGLLRDHVDHVPVRLADVGRLHPAGGSRRKPMEQAQPVYRLDQCGSLRKRHPRSH